MSEDGKSLSSSWLTDYRQNYGPLEDLLDPMIGNNQMPGPNSNGMVSHHQLQQPPIHERHQNLTALLSSNSPQKDSPNNLQNTNMGSTMHTNYSGPGPGPGPNPNQYHNNVMNAGPPMSSYATYNNNTGNGGAGGGYNSSASYTYSSTANQLYSQTSLSTTATVYNNSVSSSMPHTMSALSNGPPHNANMHPQQSNMHPNQHMQQPGQPPQHQAGMMNGPSSVNVMNSNVNRPLPNNAINPPRPSQPMVL